MDPQGVDRGLRSVRSDTRRSKDRELARASRLEREAHMAEGQSQTNKDREDTEQHVIGLTSYL